MVPTALGRPPDRLSVSYLVSCVALGCCATLGRRFIRAPQDRAAASDALVRHFGGRLVGLYYTPGAEYDGFALFEAPDDAAAAAVEMADVSAGHLRSNRLLRVLSAEEMHTALQQAATAPNIAPKRTG